MLVTTRQRYCSERNAERNKVQPADAFDLSRTDSLHSAIRSNLREGMPLRGRCLRVSGLPDDPVLRVLPTTRLTAATKATTKSSETLFQEPP